MKYRKLGCIDLISHKKLIEAISLTVYGMAGLISGSPHIDGISTALIMTDTDISMDVDIEAGKDNDYPYKTPLYDTFVYKCDRKFRIANTTTRTIESQVYIQAMNLTPDDVLFQKFKMEVDGTILPLVYVDVKTNKLHVGKWHADIEVVNETDFIERNKLYYQTDFLSINIQYTVQTPRPASFVNIKCIITP